jgi:hypothetical protein
MENNEITNILLPPPSNLVKYSSDLVKEASFFGETRYAGAFYNSKDVFGIKRVDRRRHMYVVGKSGMGKTKLLEQLIRYDIYNNMGVAVIDPHGDLVKDILDVIPEERVKDVVYVNPADVENPIAFNPFADVPMDLRQNVVQGLIEIFKKQFASNWTPRMEHLFRFTSLATLDDPEGTFYGFLEMLTNARYRQRVLTHVTDDVTRRFFATEFASFSEKYDAEAITPLTNRLGQFFSDPLMRAIFSQKENKLDITDIMNTGKILLLNISKGNLGEENGSLFGSIFLTKINQVAMARSRIPEKDRREFYIYVDEFQNVATQTFTNLFSESRKFAINLTIANQHLSQIPTHLQESIFGNVGTLIVFRVGGADAERLVQEMGPPLQVRDFINLGVQEIYVKMQIDGKTSDPFSAKVLPITPTQHKSFQEQIIRNTRTLYAQSEDRGDVPMSIESPNDDADSALPPPV